MNYNLEEYLMAMVLLRRIARQRGMTEEDIDDFISTYGEGMYLFAKEYYRGQKVEDDLTPKFQ